jgi:hypothetical protein
MFNSDRIGDMLCVRDADEMHMEFAAPDFQATGRRLL